MDVKVTRILVLKQIYLMTNTIWWCTFGVQMASVLKNKACYTSLMKAACIYFDAHINKFHTDFISSTQCKQLQEQPIFVIKKYENALKPINQYNYAFTPDDLSSVLHFGLFMD